MPAAPFIQANTNGRLHPADEPSLSPLNRGFLYGDAIYEVWRTSGGVVFAWEEHFARMEKSAAALHMTLPWTRAEMLAEVKRTTAAFRERMSFAGDLYIRLQVSRGAGPIGLDTALADRAEFVLLVQPSPVNSPEAVQRGIKLAISDLRRNPIECLNPAWKTGNYLNNLLGMREARARGADDVLMLNLRGEITEASTSNVGFVRNGEVLTPPLEAGILEGITRGALLRQVAPRAGVRARETVIRPDDLPAMDECFLLSTSRVITPVRAIDQRTFKVAPDMVSLKLLEAFNDLMRESAAAHPELKA